MKKISDTHFEQNGVVIVFRQIDDSSKFTFEVKGQKELTKKLRLSVKKPKVLYKNIYFRAKELFEIIQTGEFHEVPVGDKAQIFYESFQQKFNENPEFEITPNREIGMPRFSAKLINSKLAAVDASGSGRTKSEAKVEAIKSVLQKLNY